MKKKDLSMVIAVSVVAGVFSLIISQMFLASPDNLQTKVDVVQKISSEFPDVKVKDDNRYKSFFNAQAVNPTRLIQITNTQNQNPFGDQ